MHTQLHDAMTIHHEQTRSTISHTKDEVSIILHTMHTNHNYRVQLSLFQFFNIARI